MITSKPFVNLLSLKDLIAQKTEELEKKFID